ncbi:uncharacterized protein LOC129957497 [Argiope bruennichi]|uniref:uncharacterized protein LOC129957497 n=1 Tax=Argiope bruennichi TaxID=94029 RepID=UPI002493D0FF|nr:uncharacterized protein LOC129957497 [Argiope bruennichi]XP_055925803.1 uncharacterized protein LOC129957497 [Argiope bruennichi]XP_055925804.1 uncharacterized protein LOC129957497 [Argiope bruennichi]
MTLQTIVATVQRLFGILIVRTIANMAPTDLMRFCIFFSWTGQAYLHFTAASIGFHRRKSYGCNNESFEIDIVTVRRLLGAGRNRKVCNIEFDRIKKRSIISVPYDPLGLLCKGHSICLEKNQQAINAMRNHKLHPPLENRARELHRSAGVPLGTCAFKEVALFENHLDVQVVVISSKNLNQVAYKERYRSTRISFWLHDGHYDIIKSLKCFYGTDHYCEKYDGAFQSIENHRCPNACHIFLKCSCILTEPKRRLDCNSLCQSEQCFTAHKALVGNQMLSICERMYQCRLCCAIRRRDCSFSIYVAPKTVPHAIDLRCHLNISAVYKESLQSHPVKS